ncbi:MAG TPA: serine/threonine-protein kinase [Gemmatimonas sp.]|nr:serine/threonine-protein kinase [Gemmatimonas sp.]
MSLSGHDDGFAHEFPALSDALRGQFHVHRELGRGGMGVVYLARDERLDRMVALKVLPAELAALPATRERFLREARTAAHLAHPNIVPVYRADEVGGSAYFAMAFVDGESLADRVRDRGPLPPAEAVPILRDVAWALAYAHARGVVHRDVKPENILLERATRRTLVTDFGIAHHTTPDPSDRLTQDGHVLGTLHFMSPEQVNGEALDGRSDLYALGVVAYHILSGRLPFEGLGAAAVLVAHATKPAPPLHRVAPNVPTPLAAVVDRCLTKAPGDRFANGEALAEALEQALAVGLSAPDAFPLAPGLPARLGEAQAGALWRRAAQLQADALQRQEMTHADVQRAGAGRGSGTRATDENTEAGYRVADVAAAAEEAGISRQYVALALAELPRGTVPSDADSGIDERQASLLLGTTERSLSVSQVVRASPARTLRAIGVVLQQAPYELQLRETVGAHPLDGGVIVFAFTGTVVGFMGSSGGTSAGSVNTYWMQTQQALEARQLHVTLRAVPGDPARTDVTMTCDMRPGVRGNVRMSQGLAGTFGSLTGFFTGAVLAKGAAVALSTAVLGPAVAVGLATVGASLAAYRWAYPGIMVKARREILGALEAVAAAVQSEDVFGTLPGPGRRQRLSEDDDGTAAALIIST